MQKYRSSDWLGKSRRSKLCCAPPCCIGKANKRGLRDTGGGTSGAWFKKRLRVGNRGAGVVRVVRIAPGGAELHPGVFI